MGVLLNMLGQGLLLGYTSVLLPALQAPDSDIPVDINSSSCIASIIGTAGIPGFLASSLLMGLCGRRLTHALVVIPGITGWLCIYFATNVPALIIGRALGGFAAAATVSLGAVVIGEYTSPRNRGMFLNFKTAAVCSGNLLVHVLGHFYHWRIVALISLIPLLVSFVIICTWPESPAWLVSRNKYKESEKSFFWLRGRSEESINEMEELLKAQKERVACNTLRLNYVKNFVEFFKKFTKKDFLKPTIIVIFGSIVLESCGRHIFPAFASQIIEEITGHKDQSFYYTLGIDIIITASAVFSSVLVKLFKRRTLLFGSGLSCLLVLYSICIYLYLVSIKVISNSIPLIPILMFVVYFLLSNLGCTPIPLAFLGEIFPLPHRGAGSCVAGFALSTCLALGMQVTPFLLANLKVYGTFALLGTILGFSLLILWLVLPETKDKTLQEIEYYLNYGVYKKTDDEANLKMMVKEV
ncbi:facilitated trehalose transporter Tret1-like [Aricia agestis]|uniref:facilitated trehalose transporter Tret1-like n=1 Tax=Aricia agestis TaxID=91739 RepID=UPI001C201F62|nr:facilitated trehalose transporter Tret1-like [Aricia agestis]